MDGLWQSLTKYYGLDWVGIAFSMCATHCLAKKRKRGFLIGMIGNLAFVGFGIFAQSAANILANSVYFILNARGWIKWKQDPPNAAKPCDAAAEAEQKPARIRLQPLSNSG